MHDLDLRIVYPLDASGGPSPLVLRTELDWNHDVEPVSHDPVRHEFGFRITSQRPWLSFKPCLRTGGFRWSPGPNKVVLAGGTKTLYPYFDGASRGVLTPVLEAPRTGRAPQRLRVYLPPGYGENVHKRYPVLYMHDGRNLFFPEEAFLGRDWRVDETLARLERMNLIDQVIVVGLHAGDRLLDYTAAGFHGYGRALVDEVKPWIDRRFRTLDGPEHTGVLGSSLGGVVSFHLAWEHPDVFGTAACLSSTFGYRDELEARVLNDDLGPRASLRIYLDSGWPRDNYEATQRLAMALSQRGVPFGSRLVYLAFPDGSHDEGSWSERLHLPLQLFAGRLQRALPAVDALCEGVLA